MVKALMTCILVILAGGYASAAQDCQDFKMAGAFPSHPNSGAVKKGPEGSVPTPSFPDLMAASDSGCSNQDNITNSTTAVFMISGAVTGATVHLLRNGSSIASAVAGGSTVTLTDPNPPADALVNYSARQTVGATSSVASETAPVIFDRTAPGVTINQAAGQADPAAAAPLRYAVVFSEPVIGFSFFPPELLTASTANVNGASLLIVGDLPGPEFVFEINGVRSPGNVIMSLPAAKVVDYAGNMNTASTGTDNSISFQPQGYLGSVSGRVKTTSGSLPHGGLIVWLIDPDTGETRIAPVTPSGYFRFKNVQLYVGVQKPMVLEIRRKQRLTRDTFVLEGDYNHPDFVVEH